MAQVRRPGPHLFRLAVRFLFGAGQLVARFGLLLLKLALAPDLGVVDQVAHGFLYPSLSFLPWP